MKLLIAFGSKARHGKDSAATAIKDFYDAKRSLAYVHGYGVRISEVRIFKFAEALYKEAREDYGMTEKDAPLLQRIGSERRAQHENYWVNKVAEQLASFKGIALITDLRYRNEAAFVKSIGGFTVNVSRLNKDGSSFVAPDRPANHPSETDLDDYNWDYYIKTRDGDQVLAADYAITLAEYLVGRA